MNSEQIADNVKRLRETYAPEYDAMQTINALVELVWEMESCLYHAINFIKVDYNQETSRLKYATIYADEALDKAAPIAALKEKV